jgi:hypothetical protein
MTANITAGLISDAEKEALRERTFADSKALSYKSRFGLFSQPVTNASGETNTYKYKLAEKDEDGKVITAPRNFTTKNPRKGKIDSIYFDRPSYVSVEDLYKNSKDGKILREETKDGHKNLHDLKWKYAKQFKIPVKSAYEHLNDTVFVKKVIRDEDGHVITEPKNFYTMPSK